MAKISIIIPFYNTQNYIKRCLDAILAQTFTDFEVICVDDGSKDNTYQILQDYAKKDKRINAYTQENGGPSAARKTALVHATGKYLMFCDSDDWYEPNMCQTMFDAIEQNDVDIVCCNARVIDEQDNLQRIDAPDYYINHQIGIYPVTNEIIRETNMVLWNKIWKKSLIDQYQMNFPPCREYDDDCLYLQYMSVAEKIMFINKKLYNYFRRQNSVFGKVAQKKDSSFFDKLYIIKYYFDFLVRNNIYAQNKNTFFHYLIQIRNFGNDRWNEDNWRQAKIIFRQLFPENDEFAKFIFPSCKKICHLIKIERLNALRNNKVYRRSIYSIGKIRFTKNKLLAADSTSYKKALS